MAKREYLGEFEQLVIPAVLRLRESAYGLAVGRKIEERTHRSVSFGAAYTGLFITVALLAFVMASPAAFGQSTVDRFAGLIPRPVGPIQTHDGIVGYVPPVGWSVRNAGGGATILIGPVPINEQPCQISMLPPVPFQGDLATQGVALVESLGITQRFGPYRDDLGRDVRLGREEGISGTGWEYADLAGQLGRSMITLRVLMARMGNYVLPIIGYSKSRNCLGEVPMRDNDVWALLFHSLQLPGFTQDSPQLAQQLIGTWFSASSGAANSEVFAKNGRFGRVGLYKLDIPSTPGWVWETTTSWQGDGPYDVHGDRLHTQMARGSETERNVTRLFSIVRMPSNARPGEFDYALRVVQRSPDGSQTWGFSDSDNYVTHMTKEKSAGQ